MARKIQHKRGLEKNLPRLAAGEFALTTDTKKVFVGTDNGNIEVTNKNAVESITAQLAEVPKTVNGKAPDSNGNVTIDVPEIDTSNLATKTEVSAKRDKTTPLMLSDLHEEVKTAMTGGSVPVVGENAVGNENLKNQAISKEKLNFYAVNNVYIANAYADIDYKTFTITFRSLNAQSYGRKISDPLITVEFVDGTRKSTIAPFETVTIANNDEAFVFNLDTNSFEVIAQNSITKAHIILALRKYNGLVGGYLVEPNLTKTTNPKQQAVLIRNGTVDINGTTIIFKPNPGATMQLYTIKDNGRYANVSFTTETPYNLSAANQALVYNLHEDILETVNFTAVDLSGRLVLAVRQDTSITGGYLLDRVKKDDSLRMLYLFNIGTFRMSKGPNSTLLLRPAYLQYYIGGKGNFSKGFSADVTIGMDQAWVLNMRTNTFEVVGYTDSKLNKDYFVLAVNRYGLMYGGELKKYVKHFDTPILPIPEYNFVDFSKIPEIGSGFQSICWVGDELWVFKQSPDDHSTITGTIVRLDSEYRVIGTIAHNLGHCNSVSYNYRNDAILIGNGSESYTDYAKFDLYTNVSDWKSLNSVDYNTVPRVQYDFSSTGESKCQAVWGESNFGEENVVYMVTNDNLIFRRLLLAKGENRFDNGTLLNGKSSTEYNGTAKILQTYYGQENYGLNGGTVFRNGKLYIHSSGNNGVIENTFSLDSNKAPGEVTVRKLIFPAYGANGSQITLFPQGLTVKGNKLYASFVDGKTGMISFDIPA